MTADNERDPVVSRALRELPVPAHRPGFWEDLDARLAADERGDLRIETGELPSIAALRPEPPVNPVHRARFLAVAAAVAVVALAAGVVLRGAGDDTGGADLADGDVATTLVPGSAAAAPTPPEAVPAVPGAAPRDAVLEWLTALAYGDVEHAASLLGPGSRRYLASIDGDPVGFMDELEEGYGGWLASPDLRFAELDIPRAGVVVTVQGTWRGEGESYDRVDAIPTVQADDGRWLVEPLAFSPRTGGRPELVTPAVIVGGWEGQPPDVVLEASSEDRAVTFWFSLDGRAPVPDTDGVWDPPGDLPSGTHSLVVAVTGDGIFGALAGTFVVEG